jgi:acyl CoA:acetate/3-ketoacid CoA transferase alpha subunit/acyl CoA:acetate/3-ketoacid CoA transferase beta subunit
MERMQKLLHDPIFSVQGSETGSKVMPLKEAVSRYVKQGMMIHTCQTSIRWCHAIFNEITRQFWGKRGDFTLAGISMNFPHAVLVHGGLVKKMITSYFGDPYIVPSPNRVFQKAVKEGTLEIEHWSIYTITLRLQAAALNLPFLPTHSLLGSTMEQDNKKDLVVMDDPLREGEKIALVSALQPDLTIAHGWLADSEGNAVFLAPLGENIKGALGSKKGVILTVEKIVPTEKLRKYSHMVKLPGTYVKSVSEVPFGAHPSGLSRAGLDELDLYSEDYAFIEEVHQAGKNKDSFQAWIDQWVLSCSGHEDYLAKLGHERIQRLTGQSNPESWRVNFSSLEKITDDEKYTPIEMAMVVMARILAQKVKKNKHKTLLAGAGIANLASWLCFYKLKQEDYPLELMAEIGMYGYVPCPTEPILFNTSNFATCKITTDIPTIMGLFVGGIKANCIGALGAAQIDQHGSINTTKMDQDNVIVGSGGANDVCSVAKDVVVILPQSSDRLLTDVYYITSPGKNVSTVVSTMGVFEKMANDSGFTLTGYFPSNEENLEKIIEKFQKKSSWAFNVGKNLKEIKPPAHDELRMLRIFDPNRYYLGALK